MNKERSGNDRSGIRLLTGYYGLVQVLHLVVLACGLVGYIQSGTIGFPAPAPLEGWTDQAEAFLLGNGALDAIIGAGAILFVIGFYKGKEWNRTLGLICLTASLCSGGFFIFGTAASGAWQVHPANYAGLILVFTSVVVLYLMMIRSALRAVAPAIAKI
ncbi:MAG: hypothetical protein E4G99_04265 [Anaerolineales bacterium]|nr:MAG: hypothetical protein E4G99_04265 [Anaerolineales bacterium]